MIRTYTFRLYPTRTQGAEFVRTIDACRDLYNAALQQRKEAYRRQGKTLSAITQGHELKDISAKGGPFYGVRRRPLQYALRRLDAAYAAFFRRLKTDQAPGFPRFKGKAHFNSFSTSKTTHNENHLNIFGLSVRWKPWREVPPKDSVKLVRIIRKADGWYAAVICEVAPKPLPSTGKVIGIDLGLLSLVATSDGETIPVDAGLRKKERRLKRWQRKLSRQKKGSNRRRKTRKIFARRHLDLARSRKYALDCLTRRIVNENDVVVVEDLDVAKMNDLGGRNAQGRGLRRSMHRASWGKLLAQLDGKAEEAGRVVVRVDPRSTSQECSNCGAVVKKALSERVHRCPCGLTLDRDVNAAKVILERGLRLLRGGTAAASASQRTEKLTCSTSQLASSGITRPHYHYLN